MMRLAYITSALSSKIESRSCVSDVASDAVAAQINIQKT